MTDTHIPRSLPDSWSEARAGHSAMQTSQLQPIPRQKAWAKERRTLVTARFWIHPSHGSAEKTTEAMARIIVFAAVPASQRPFLHKRQLNFA